MNYAEYRRRGLPISSAPVESAIKQLNRRVKGTEKFWVSGGAESMLQVRTAILSEDRRCDPNATFLSGKLGVGISNRNFFFFHLAIGLETGRFRRFGPVETVVVASRLRRN